MIRPVELSDAVDIASIYNHYIETSIYTFETEKVEVDEIQERIRVTQSKYPYLVYCVDNKVVAYAYLSLFRARCAYSHVAESSIYVDSAYIGQGIGTTLYQALLDEGVRQGYTEIIGVLAMPNPVSETFHARLGFKSVGKLERMGFKFDTFIPIGFWQYSSLN